MKSSVINAISTYLFYISTLIGWNGETIIHTDKYIHLVQICLIEHLVDNISNISNLVRPVLHKVDATLIYSQDLMPGMYLRTSRYSECWRK